MTTARLLVLDDEVDFGTFVAHVARESGFAVEITTSANDFQEAYQRFEPTHITLDMVMPEKDGIEVVRWLAAIGCKSRIVIMTGYHPRYAAAAREIGRIQGLSPILILKKPVSLADLRAVLDGSHPGLGIVTEPSSGTPS
jgi:DNA-binding response OmpR family regulator